MKTKITLLCYACITSLFSVLKAQAAPKPDEKKPNIILLMTDQQRFDCLGIIGNGAIKTPNMDALARDGLLFLNGYSSTPSSTPARAALLTGMAPWHNGLLGYGDIAEHYNFEMPQMLRDNGYYTYAVGKLHYAPQRNLHGYEGASLDESGRVQTLGFVSDYRQWFLKVAPGLNPDSTGIGWNEHTGKVYALDEKFHPTTWTANEAIRFIDEYNSERPFFLTVSFARPHSPYDPPQRFFEEYENVTLPVPYIGDWCQNFASKSETKNAAFGNFGEKHTLESRRFYYASISFIDEKIGQIIVELKKRGMYENSLIVFVSDHGDMLGDHYHWRKTYAYEGSSHIPFIVKFPENKKGDCPKGTKMEQPVELRDILPTFLDVTGIPIPSEIDGRSIYSLYKNKNAEWRTYIDLEHTASYDENGYWAALTDGEMKYIYFFPTGEEQLFDISINKGELHNLATDPEYRQTLEIWRTRMIRHLKERGEPYVKKGKLQIIKKGILYGPKYPGPVKPSGKIQ